MVGGQRTGGRTLMLPPSHLFIVGFCSVQASTWLPVQDEGSLQADDLADVQAYGGGGESDQDRSMNDLALPAATCCRADLFVHAVHGGTWYRSFYKSVLPFFYLFYNKASSMSHAAHGFVACSCLADFVGQAAACCQASAASFLGDFPGRRDGDEGRDFDCPPALHHHMHDFCMLP